MYLALVQLETEKKVQDNISIIAKKQFGSKLLDIFT
jgi:hypothetical protein